ncbi:MAG: rod shape-determining protein MreD [Clostridia bacterium]|nr:rod shape-determining protein MreD [Clostridia bacterium]
MRGYKWYVVLMLGMAVIMQPYLNKWLSVAGVSINFVMFIVMMTAFEKTYKDAVIAASIAGIAYDMLYSPWIGRMTIVLLLSVLMVFLVNKMVYRNNAPVLTLFFLTSVFILENISTIMELGPAIYFRSFSFIQVELFRISLYGGVLAAILGIWFFAFSLIRDRKLATGKARLE